MNSSIIGGSGRVQLRGSVARFFDTPNNKTKNESASNLLSGLQKHRPYHNSDNDNDNNNNNHDDSNNNNSDRVNHIILLLD